MQLTMLHSKLHNAKVTQCDLYYEGSISIDSELLTQAGMLPFERVDVWNINNGARIQTYVIEAPPGSRAIGLNGAAARHFQVGDLVIIATFVAIDLQSAPSHRPTVVILTHESGVNAAAKRVPQFSRIEHAATPNANVNSRDSFNAQELLA